MRLTFPQNIVSRYLQIHADSPSRPKLSEKDYAHFVEHLYQINALRLKLFFPLLLLVYLLAMATDFWAYYSNQADSRIYYLYNLALHSFAFFLFIFLFSWFIYREGFVDGKDKSFVRRYVVISFAYLIPIQCTGVALIAVFVTGQINSHLVGMLSVAIFFTLSNRFAFWLFTFIQVLFTIGVFWISLPFEYALSFITSSFVFYLVVLFVSRILFYGRMSNFHYQNELKKNNEELEQQVKMRSEQLLSNLQMASLGMQAAEIVHNLKNPLSIIRGYSDLLRNKYPTEKALPHIVEGCDRLEGTICTILQNTAQKISQGEGEFCFDELIQNEMKMLKASSAFFKNKVELEMDLQSPKIRRGYPGQLSQCFDNFFKNALDAMHLSSEKKLKVKTKDHGNVTIITIEDSGEGIPIEKIERIFDPFYTTKPSVRKNKDEPTGTGLGLPYCKRVIELHQGRILVDSQRGSGTTIKIIFAS